jgi:hypothetical protein
VHRRRGRGCRYLPEGTSLIHLANDPDEAARAPVGDAIVADLRSAVEALLAAATTSQRPQPPPPAPMNAPTALRLIAATIEQEFTASVEADDRHGPPPEWITAPEVGIAAATEKRAQQTDDQRERVAEAGHAELIVELGADDREFGEGGIQQIALQPWKIRRTSPRIVVSASSSGRVARNA